MNIKRIFGKSTLIMLIGVLLFSGLTFGISHAAGTWAHSTLQTHPNLVPLTTTSGTFSWTAKRFEANVGINPTIVKNINRPIMWGWSGPGDGSYRDVHYASPNGNPGNCYSQNNCLEWKIDHEWESWTYTWSNPNSLRNLQYAGPTPATSKWVYPTQTDCINNTNAGYIYPNLAQGELYSFSPISIKDPTYPYNNNCRPEYSASNPNGGYIAAYRAWDGNGSGTEWDWGNTSLDRDWYCDQYFKAPHYNVEDPTTNDIADKICRAAPQVETVYQVYVWGSGGTNGCEAIVYVSGYPQPNISTPAPAANSIEVKNWFRNGELRWGKWINVGSTNHGPNARQNWMNTCNAAFKQTGSYPVENWFYTGIYKLNNIVYQDWGNSAAPTQYMASSCPTGWTPNAANSCDSHEGAIITSGSCPAGYYPQVFEVGGIQNTRCMSNYP